MNEKEFKDKFKNAICTKDPLFSFIPYKDRIKILRKIKQETIDAYGYSLEECPERHTCDGECKGRELPWKSETAQPYLKMLAQTSKIVDNKLFITKCDLCPIKSNCTSVCIEINDYMNRGDVREPNLFYNDNIEHYSKPETDVLVDIKNMFTGLEIPWDYLSVTRRKVIDLYALEGKDFSHVAALTGLYDQAAAKYEFYAGLTNLSRCAIMRKFLTENETKLNNNQKNILTKLYINNKNKTEVAKELGITKQAVQQTEDRIIKNYNISWQTFVRKKNGKVFYDTSELFK